MLILKIKVLFFTTLREIIGKREETIDLLVDDKITINTVLNVLKERYDKPFEDYVFDPKTQQVRGHIQFLINGKSISHINEMEIELKDGNVLAILPPVGGG